jgi:hypothetical protein
VDSFSLRDASAITPNLDPAESVAGQVVGAEGTTVSQGETERQESLRTTVRLRRCGCYRSCLTHAFLRYGVLCVKMLMR